MTKNSDTADPVACAETREALEAFIAHERVEAYIEPGVHSFSGRDHVWRKIFRIGGPLEWYNAPEALFSEFPPFVDIGSREDWAERARRDYDEFTSGLFNHK